MAFEIDESTGFGARVARRLREETLIWLTATSRSGTPSPNPVWFQWDGADRVVVFSQPTAVRIMHLTNHPRLALNFNTGADGNDVVVFTGSADVEPPGAPKATDLPGYIAKYERLLPGIDLTPESFAASYSVPIVITLEKVRGF